MTAAIAGATFFMGVTLGLYLRELVATRWFRRWFAKRAPEAAMSFCDFVVGAIVGSALITGSLLLINALVNWSVRK